MTLLDTFMTPKVLKINPEAPHFASNLSIQKANKLYNQLGGASFCTCKRDCHLNPKCSCMLLGKLCQEKCHQSRSDGKHVKCTNCLLPNDIMVAEPMTLNNSD